MTVEQIFSEIINHMVKGLMIHEHLANYYDFLGLQGYRQCHEYHYKEESCSYRKLYHFYITTYNRLLPDMRFENPEVIPSNWISYTRQDVDMKTKRMAVQEGLTKWVNWERSTLDLYKEMYQELIKLGEIGSAVRLEENICDVMEELKTAEKYQLNKVAINYDMNIIVDEQRKLHDKYKYK